ncbi:oxidation resistance protein 1 [Entomortierella beljakovae]|nr:oxidation resistance protein 1 [Entomortierella beljakovae]
MIPRKAKQTVLNLVTTEQSKHGAVRSTQSTVSGGDWGEPSNDHQNTQGFEPNSAGSGQQDPWMMVTGSGASFANNNTIGGPLSSGYPSNVSTTPISAREEQMSKLPPLRLLERREDTDPVLDVDIAQQIRLELPRKLRNATKWNLVYSSDQHGISMTTLYHRCKGKGPMVLAIKDTSDCIFGAFVTEEFKTNLSYYGTGESFLWSVTTLASSPKPSVSPLPSPSPLQLSSNAPTPRAERSRSPAQNINNNNNGDRRQEIFNAMNDQLNARGGSPASLSAPQSQQLGLSPTVSPSLRPTVSSSSANGTPSRKKKKQKVVRCWKWTGKNDYVILSEPGFLGLGGGNGKFGLWIHADLEMGHSDRCDTFDNEPLASACRHPIRADELKESPASVKSNTNSRSGSPKDDKEEFYCQTVEIWSMVL